MTKDEEIACLKKMLTEMAHRAIDPPIVTPIGFSIYEKVYDHLSKIPKRSKFYKHAQAALKEVSPKPIS